MSESNLYQAIGLARSGRKTEARRLLQQILKADKTNEIAWLWYAECVETPAERAQALEACVRINPQAQRVRLTLSAMQTNGVFTEDAAPAVFVGDAVADAIADVPAGVAEDQARKQNRSLSAADQWVLSTDSSVFTVSPEQITDAEFKRVMERTETFLMKNPDLKPVWKPGTSERGAEKPYRPVDIEAPVLPSAPPAEPEKALPPVPKSHKKSRGAVYALLLVALMAALLIGAVILL